MAACPPISPAFASAPAASAPITLARNSIGEFPFCSHVTMSEFFGQRKAHQNNCGRHKLIGPAACNLCLYFGTALPYGLNTLVWPGRHDNRETGVEGLHGLLQPRRPSLALPQAAQRNAEVLLRPRP